MIQKILNGYKLPEILEKYLGKKETGLFLDLAAYSLISENNAAQYVSASKHGVVTILHTIDIL